MTEQLSTEVLKRVDALASQLHTTGSQLWQVLVAQARVEAITDLCQLGLLTLGMVALGWFEYWLIKKGSNPQVDYDTQETCGITSCVLGIILIVGVGIWMGICTNWVTPMLNPQYWALQQVMGLFKR